MGFRISGSIASKMFLVSALAAGCLAAQTATSSDLPGVDLSGLSAAQKTTAQKILQEQGCSCGCDMKIAECRVKDPACGYSSGLAAAVARIMAERHCSEKWFVPSALSSLAAQCSTCSQLIDSDNRPQMPVLIRGRMGLPNVV